MSTIVELRAENVKRLRAVTIKPDGSLVVIGGQNAQGKTSLLDSIAYCLGGKDLCPAEPLRRGEDHGEVQVTLDDGMVIRRTFTPSGGGSLTVTGKDGARYPSPQTLLNGLISKISFDPMEFMRMKPRDQAETVRKLVGLDFTALDAKRQAAYDKRTTVNQEVARLQGALSKLPQTPAGTPEKETSIDELAAELERRRGQNALHAAAGAKLAGLRDEAVRLKKQIADLQAQLVRVQTDGKSAAEAYAAMTAADEQQVLGQLKTIQSTNAEVRSAAERAKLQKELDIQNATSLELTGSLADIDKEKAETLAKAKMPIDGMTFTDEGVRLNGLGLDQASSAEQLRTSVAIGIAMNPKFKVLPIRDGSLLDEKNLAMVAEMAAKAGGQIWIERVGKGAECSVVIEDGMVVGAVAEKPVAAVAEREPGSDDDKPEPQADNAVPEEVAKQRAGRAWKIAKEKGLTVANWHAMCRDILGQTGYGNLPQGKLDALDRAIAEMPSK